MQRNEHNACGGATDWDSESLEGGGGGESGLSPPPSTGLHALGHPPVLTRPWRRFAHLISASAVPGQALLPFLGTIARAFGFLETRASGGRAKRDSSEQTRSRSRWSRVHALQRRGHNCISVFGTALESRRRRLALDTARFELPLWVMKVGGS